MQQPFINAGNEIVDPDLTMTDQFRGVLNRLTNNLPLTGTGSPEGVVEAVQFSWYIDDAGATANILYIKRDTDIGGDKTKGWILV